MNLDRYLSLLVAPAAAVVLAACGGGGGSTTPTPDVLPDASDGPQTEAPAGSGLQPATGTLVLSQTQAASLLNKALEAYGKAPGGAASASLGAFAPSLGAAASATANCPGGGTVVYTPLGAGAASYTYNDCIVDGMTYAGLAPVSFTLAGSAVQSYEIDQRAVTSLVDGQTVALNGRSACTVSGSETVCVGHYQPNTWGSGFAFSGGIANGSYQCECDADRWNSTFKDFTQTSGSVTTVAGSGSAEIVHTGPNAVDVQITVGGQSRTFALLLRP